MSEHHTGIMEHQCNALAKQYDGNMCSPQRFSCESFLLIVPANSEVRYLALRRTSQRTPNQPT